MKHGRCVAAVALTLALLAVPGWAWLELRRALEAHSEQARALEVAREQVSELLASTLQTRASLEPTSQSKIMQSVASSAAAAGVDRTQIIELATRNEPIRTASGDVQTVQRTRLRLQGISPQQLGAFLEALRLALPEMITSEIELTRAGGSAEPNKFAALVVLEQYLLRDPDTGVDS